MRFTTYGNWWAWLLLLCLTAPTLRAQVNITYPTNRIVLQRDKNNAATIYIRGTYTRPIDRVEVQLRAINGGNTSGWITIANNTQGGTYSGEVNWTGGWYEMEIRGWKGGQLVGSSTLPRLGIGEVFLIAGQSNAQGYSNYGGPGANDDRVNRVNYYNIASTNELPQPSFDHLNADSYLSPRGNSAWAYGRLGDLLAARLGVPILFYNAGWYGSAVSNWRQSINGTAYSVYNGEAFSPAGMPYGNLRLVLQYYVPITGIRGVLWHQGEADNFTNTSSGSYSNDLKTIINQSRAETGKNLSWVVSRVSYDNQRGSSAAVIRGQNDAIASTPNTFYGPETDKIQAPRPDGAHFQDAGLSQLGEAWNAALNDDFFARSEPHKSVSSPRVRIACAGNNTVALSLEGGNYSSISWNNGQSGANITVGGGRYSAKVRDASGNLLFVPEIEISGQVQPPQPTINLEGSNNICQGSFITLTASSDDNIRWNTGQTEKRITTSTANTFSVTASNVYGCESTSAPVTIGVFSTPPPSKPSISVQGTTVFCAGGGVTLNSNASVQSVWSDGQRGGSISVGNSGDFRVTAVDDNGCRSPESDPVTIVVNPLPSRPVVAVSGATTFCEGGNVTLTSNYENGNRWNTDTPNRSITVARSGEYIVSVTDGNGCESTSDPIRVQVNPLPAPPAITALRPLTFCERDYTVLQASSSNSYQWSNGGNQREIEVRNSGNFTLTTIDQNGCQSANSSSVTVTMNPLPPRPSITASGATTFCADQQVTLRSTPAEGYIWNNGATRQETTISQSGTYQVQTRNEFGCISDPADRIAINVLPLPAAPTVTALGRTVFCEGETVQLTANGSGSFSWNTGASGQVLTAAETGNYAARVQGANGCFSPFSTPLRLEAKITPDRPTIVQAGTYTLQANPALPNEFFFWQRNNDTLSVNQSVIKATQPGLFAVQAVITYSPTLSCFSEKSASFNFIPEAGGNGISVYPNPTDDGMLTLETLENLENVTIQVFDLKGIIVKSFFVSSFDERKFIDLSLLPGGLYIVKITSDTFNATQRLMVSR